MRSFSVYALILLGGAHSLQAIADTPDGPEPVGVLCLRKLPPPKAYATAGKGADTVDYPDSAESRESRIQAAKNAKRWIQVDRRDPVLITSAQGGCVDRLSMKGNHKVQSLNDRKKAVSGFWFSFSQQGRNQPLLKLYFDPFYATDRVEPIRRKRTGPASCDECPR